MTTPLLALPPPETHLWLVLNDADVDPVLLAQYRKLLSPQEIEQQSRFRFPSDQQRYLITRALARTVLSRYAAVAPDQWRFEPDRYGKPHIANHEPDARAIRFNITHTPGLVMLGLTRERAIGIDTEYIRDRRTPYLDLAERFFSTAETQNLRALPAHAQRDRFFEYWTLKESYMKACGKGLSMPLEQFGFVIQGSALSLLIDPDLADDPGHWRFWLLKPSPDHFAAVCVARLETGNQKLVTRKITPLDSEEIFHCVEVGESG